MKKDRLRVGLLGLSFCLPALILPLSAQTDREVDPYDSVGLKREVWTNIGSNMVSALVASSRYPNSPDFGVLYQNDLRFPKNAAVTNLSEYERYGQRFSGYLIAPRSGLYTLWVGGNNTAELWLSSDTNPANVQKVAYVDTHNNLNTTAGSPDKNLPIWLSNGTNTGKSSNNTNFQFPGRAPGEIYLKGGEPYYIELLHKEGTGTEFVAAGWTKPGDTPQASQPTEVIPARFLSPNLPATVVITGLTRRHQASRFLAQATFGPSPGALDDLTTKLTANPSTAFETWIDAQIAPLTTTQREQNSALKRFRDFCDAQPDWPVPATKPIEWNDSADGPWSPSLYVTKPRRPYTHQASVIRASLMIDDELQLRRKMAYALSQIVVLSDQGDLIGHPESMCDWMDTLYLHAFGKFEDLLLAVARHPAMGFYLSHANNKKATANTQPDENFAREIMQLFSIGLYQLEMNGRYRNDILTPTYGNDDVMELARVFTGQIYKTGPVESAIRYDDANNYPDPIHYLRKTANTKAPPPNQLGPAEMDLRDVNHDFDAKSYFVSLPSATVNHPQGLAILDDLQIAVEGLADHPSAGPFIARALIQRFVTSNPSEHYVNEVAAVYVSSGHDLGEVIKAVLLRAEARSLNMPSNDDYGKLREPWVRLMHLARSFPAAKVSGTDKIGYPLFKSKLNPILGQYQLASPSVFNFYLPSHEPLGDITERNAEKALTDIRLVGPEFEILNDNTAIQTPKYLYETSKKINTAANSNSGATLALTASPAQLALAANPADLVAEVDTFLTHGMMSARTRQIITDAVAAIPTSSANSQLERVKMAIYLTSISPDFAAQK